MADGKRMHRVDAEIQKTLAEIISRFDDTEITTTLVSVMKVETYSDLSMSKVFVSVYGSDEKKQNIIKKLNDNKKTLRYDLAHNLKMRNVPELMFIVDEVEEKAERIMKLFEKIETETPEILEPQTESEGDSSDVE